MTETIAPPEGSTQPQRVEVAPIALFVAMVGFFTTGAGMIWNWSNPSASSYLWLEVVGPVLIAGAMLSHVRKVGERIGHVAAVALTLSFSLWGIANLPFALNSANAGRPRWQSFFYHAWGASFLLISLSAFAILWNKEDRLVRHDDDPRRSISVSFRTLTATGLASFIFSIGYFIQGKYPQGTRLSTFLQVLGPLLIAVVMIVTMNQMAKYIGRISITFGILAFSLWGLSALPFLISPSFANNATWAPFFLFGCFGIGYVLIGFEILLIANALSASAKTQTR